MPALAWQELWPVLGKSISPTLSSLIGSRKTPPSVESSQDYSSPQAKKRRLHQPRNISTHLSFGNFGQSM